MLTNWNNVECGRYSDSFHAMNYYEKRSSFFPNSTLTHQKHHDVANH